MTDLRVGLGYDLHPFVEGRPLVLGGVEILSARGLAGHSDGDPLSHALIDALLGAAGQGDIGELFPPGDERYRGAYSLDLLRVVATRLLNEGWRVINADTTIIAQEPRLAPHRAKIRAAVAGALQVSESQLNVKATAPEGLGALGRAEGVAALATVLMERG